MKKSVTPDESQDQLHGQAFGLSEDLTFGFQQEKKQNFRRRGGERNTLKIEQIMAFVLPGMIFGISSNSRLFRIQPNARRE